MTGIINNFKSTYDNLIGGLADDAPDVLLIGENHASIIQRIFLKLMIPKLAEIGFSGLSLEDPAHHTNSIRHFAKNPFGEGGFPPRFDNPDKAILHYNKVYQFGAAAWGEKAARLGIELDHMEEFSDYCWLSMISTAYSKHAVTREADRLGFDLQGVDLSRWAIRAPEEARFEPAGIKPVTRIEKLDHTTREGMTIRNHVMAGRIYEMFQDNKGSIVHLGGLLHNHDLPGRRAERSLQGLLEDKYGLSTHTVSIGQTLSSLGDIKRLYQEPVRSRYMPEGRYGALKADLKNDSAIIEWRTEADLITGRQSADHYIICPDSYGDYKQRFYALEEMSHNRYIERNFWNKVHDRLRHDLG